MNEPDPPAEPPPAPPPAASLPFVPTPGISLTQERSFCAVHFEPFRPGAPKGCLPFIIRALNAVLGQEGFVAYAQGQVANVCRRPGLGTPYRLCDPATGERKTVAHVCFGCVVRRIRNGP